MSLLTDEEIDNIEKDCWENLNTDNCITFARAIEQAVMAKLLEQNEPIYQLRCRDGTWIDQNEQSYKYNLEHGHTARKLYEHPAPSALEWISVEGRLPEQEQSVLVSRTGLSYPQITCYYDKDWVLESNHYPVTHWMPLPKPPMTAARSE